MYILTTDQSGAGDPRATETETELLLLCGDPPSATIRRAYAAAMLEADAKGGAPVTGHPRLLAVTGAPPSEIWPGGGPEGVRRGSRGGPEGHPRLLAVPGAPLICLRSGQEGVRRGSRG
eukprot:391255-Prorocentrum_minimum.AAC.1